MAASNVPIALTIAGSDSSGGAGIQADLKTFTAFGVYGASVITALTAQNTMGVQGVSAVPPDFVAAQMTSVFSDLDVRAVKTGMLATSEIIAAVAAGLDSAPNIPLVVDPVMVATSGDPLLQPNAVAAFKSMLFPRAALITPNLPEAARLLDTTLARNESEARDQLLALGRLGAKAVLLKGGHGESSEAIDLLLISGTIRRFAHPRIATKNTHGTGCTLSAAIAALIALGADLETAVARAKTYVHQAIEAARLHTVGRGHGPVDHLYAIRKAAPPA